jgi:uncharacterized protein
MPVPGRVSVVALQVSDLARSSAFYQALGWPRSAASREGIAFFNTSGGLLALYDAGLLAALEVDLPAAPAGGFRGVVRRSTPPPPRRWTRACGWPRRPAPTW